MRIIIDERETGLYEKCIEFNTNESIHITKQVLALGDILFQTDDGTLVSIIERKSLTDLLASVKDGRYDEQSHRLSHNGECSLHNVVYLIEGMLSTLRNPAEKKLVYSCIASLNFIKGFSVLRSVNITETAEMLIFMADKIGRSGAKMQHIDSNTITSAITDQNYCTVVKKVKKDNITPENIGEIILCQIPGISSTTAVAIMKHFPSFPALIDAIKTDPKCLENLTCESTGGKTRKINKKCLESIHTFLGPGTSTVKE
jgi:ERCC4-type nuclease